MNNGTLELPEFGKTPQFPEGKCGDHMIWHLVGETLYITGTGTLCKTEDLKAIKHRIKNVVIDEGCTVIGECAFYSWKQLTSVQLPDTLKEIEGHAFYDCTALTDLVLPEGLTVIGAFAFADGNCLHDLGIPDSVKEIGQYAFRSIPCIQYHDEPHLFLDRSLFRDDRWRLLKIFCSDGFQYVRECQDQLFGTFIAPSRGFIDGYKPEISYPEGVVITRYVGNEAEVTIPSVLDGQRVAGIGRAAFAGQKQLRSVYMEEGIVRIGIEAFSKCSNLQSVHFPQSLEMIDGDAFSDTALAELSLPANLRKIGQLAFSDTQIEELILPEKLEVLGDDAFIECKKLRKVYIPANIECFVDAQAEDGWPMDLIYEQYSPNLGDDDDAYYKRTDIEMYDGSINTFADCPRLTEVEDQYGLNSWQKKSMFGNTPWLEEEKSKETWKRFL